MRIITLFCLMVCCIHTTQTTMAQSKSNNDRKLAIYLSSNKDVKNYQADLSSLRQIISVTGLPAIISSDFSECLDYGMILFGNVLYENTLSTSQKVMLEKYVTDGGSIIIPGLTDKDLFELAGIKKSEISNKRYHISFVSDIVANEFRWIDEDYEKTIQLGALFYDEIFPTIAYEQTDSEVIAVYDDSGEPALLKNKYGNGLVYTFGLKWSDVIIRNLMDKDFQSNRYYSNGFDATADVFMLLIRGMFAEAIPNAVWLSPAPYDSKSAFIVTHDVCSHTAHIFANDFAQMEQERGISATYNITTHQFIDDINGDNYSSHIPQMRLLINKGHTIGSHSYGHFPDFADEAIFPKGEPISYKDYNPHFSVEEGKTIGGTTFGELGVSKELLEKDLNTMVKYYRSGHLAINPYQYDVLNELGYTYSSTYAAADLLTGFPFYAHAGNFMNGDRLPIIELPMAISDVFGNDEITIDEFNWKDKADIWLDVTNSYANNNALTLILVHPNRNFKLDALNYVLDNLSKDIIPIGFGEYAEFWKEKEQIEFSSKIEGSLLKIFANESFYNNEAHSFVIDNTFLIDKIELYNNNGELMDHYQHDYYEGTSIVYQKGIEALKSDFVSPYIEQELLYQNYPNPFSYQTTIKYHVPEKAKIELKVIDLYGREVDVLVNNEQEEGVYEIDFKRSKLSGGVYFVRIHMTSSQNYVTATRKMIIR